MKFFIRIVPPQLVVGVERWYLVALVRFFAEFDLKLGLGDDLYGCAKAQGCSAVGRAFEPVVEHNIEAFNLRGGELFRRIIEKIVEELGVVKGQIFRSANFGDKTVVGRPEWPELAILDAALQFDVRELRKGGHVGHVDLL